jgi:hypothetical protein
MRYIYGKIFSTIWSKTIPLKNQLLRDPIKFLDKNLYRVVSRGFWKKGLCHLELVLNFLFDYSSIFSFVQLYSITSLTNNFDHIERSWPFSKMNSIDHQRKISASWTNRDKYLLFWDVSSDSILGEAKLFHIGYFHSLFSIDDDYYYYSTLLCYYLYW